MIYVNVCVRTHERNTHYLHIYVCLFIKLYKTNMAAMKCFLPPFSFFCQKRCNFATKYINTCRYDS